MGSGDGGGAMNRVLGIVQWCMVGGVLWALWTMAVFATGGR